MAPLDVLNHLTAEPFRPFRMRTTSGRSFEVLYPEVVQVGRTTLTIFAPLSDEVEAEGTWYKLSLMLTESIEPLDAPVQPRAD